MLIFHFSVQGSAIQSRGIRICRFHLAYWSLFQKQGMFSSVVHSRLEHKCWSGPDDWQSLFSSCSFLNGLPLFLRKNLRKFALITTCSFIWRATHLSIISAARSSPSTTQQRSFVGSYWKPEEWVFNEKIFNQKKIGILARKINGIQKTSSLLFSCYYFLNKLTCFWFQSTEWTNKAPVG